MKTPLFDPFLGPVGWARKNSTDYWTLVQEVSLFCRCSTWNMLASVIKNSILLLLLGLTSLAIGCNRKDPMPELRDPLYNELQVKLKEVEAELAAAQAALAEAESNLGKVVPQTGQIKYANKRLWQATDKIMKLGQQKRYLEIKIESQKWRAKEEYLISFYKKTPWPTQKPLEDFQTMQKAQQIERNWSAKARREELHLPVGRQPAVAPKPAAASGGGH